MPRSSSAATRSLNAPFVGDGFTRWVDGQYALDRPELGLANWQNGRLIGRGAILSGDSVHTIRYVATDHRSVNAPLTGPVERSAQIQTPLTSTIT